MRLCARSVADPLSDMKHGGAGFLFAPVLLSFSSVALHRATSGIPSTRTRVPVGGLAEELKNRALGAYEKPFVQKIEPDDEGRLRVLGPCRHRLGERVCRGSCVHSEVIRLQLHLMASLCCGCPLVAWIRACLPRKSPLPVHESTAVGDRAHKNRACVEAGVRSLFHGLHPHSGLIATLGLRSMPHNVICLARYEPLYESHT